MRSYDAIRSHSVAEGMKKTPHPMRESTQVTGIWNDDT